MNVLNIYGEDEGEPVELPYIKKTGDTATGLIIFDAGIEVNNGTTAINGPAEFADTVLFKPSSTIVIDGSLELTGPSFIDSCQTTEFNGNLVEFNGPLVEFNSAQTTFNGPVIDIVGAAATTLNTDCEININLTNHNTVNVECPINLGGFASMTLTNADINMWDNSLILQNIGTRTQNNILGSSEIKNGSYIQYLSDNTQQSSAYTGAGALAGSYTASDITLDSNGRITAISSSAAPTSLTLNNLNIPIGGLNILSPGLGGIQNPVNNGGKAYISGTTITAAANWVPAGVASQGFLICFSDTLSTNSIPLVTVRITFSYVVFNNSSGNPVPFQWGKCYFDMDLYPGSFNSANVTAYPMNQYNVSNYISGNNAFNQTSALIPNGRPYWCYNQNYVNPSTLGPIYGYIAPIATTPTSAIIPNRWAVFPTMYTTLNPAVATYAYEGSIEVLNCQAANAVSIGVGVSSINA